MAEKYTQFMGSIQVHRVGQERLKRIIDSLADIALGAAMTDGRIVFDIQLTIRLENDSPSASSSPTATEIER